MTSRSNKHDVTNITTAHVTKLTAFIHSSISELKFVVSRIKFLSEDLIMQMAERKRMMTVCKKSMPRECSQYILSISSDGSRVSKTGGGKPTSEFGAKTYYFARFFSENCMKR